MEAIYRPPLHMTEVPQVVAKEERSVHKVRKRRLSGKMLCPIPSPFLRG